MGLLGTAALWLVKKALPAGVEALADLFTSDEGSNIADDVGDVVSRITGAQKANDTMRDLQLELLQKQQDFTTSERLSEQSWQDYQRLESQGWQKEMYDYQQQNGAVMQLKSLVDAGVNPNTAVGAIGSGSVASAPSPSAPVGASSQAPSPAPYHTMFEGLQSFVNSIAQATKLKSETAVNNATAAKLRGEADILVIDKATRPLMNQASIDELRGRLYGEVQRGLLDKATADQILELTPALVSKTYAEIDEVCSTIDTMAAQRAEMAKHIEQMSAEIETEKARVKALDAEAYEAYKSGDASERLSKAQKDLYEAQEKMQTLNNEWTEKCHEFGVNPNSDNLSNAVGFYMTHKDKFISLINNLKGSGNEPAVTPPLGMPDNNADFAAEALVNALNKSKEKANNQNREPGHIPYRPPWQK